MGLNSSAVTHDLIRAYVDAFNRGDAEALFATLADDVVHDINEGETEIGLDAFRAFKAGMDRDYRETLEEVVVFAEGDRGACEFVVRGEYVGTQPGLPEATGQRYAIPAAFFVTVRNGKIGRITSYYNLRRWIAAVSS